MDPLLGDMPVSTIDAMTVQGMYFKSFQIHTVFHWLIQILLHVVLKYVLLAGY